MRHDDGDGETGAGIEPGGGVAYADAASGLSVDLDAVRREPANDNGPPEHGVTLRSLIRW